MICGVYIITNATNGRFYIGSSMNLKTRIAGHKSTLKRGRHHNKELQKDFKLFGGEYFSFCTLVICEHWMQAITEDAIINSYHGEKKDLMYNKSTQCHGIEIGCLRSYAKFISRKQVK